MFIYLVKVGVYLVIERGQAIGEGDESARRGRAENFAVFRAMGCDAAAPFKRPCNRRRAHEAAKRDYSNVGKTISPRRCAAMVSSSYAPKKSQLLSIQRANARRSSGVSSSP